MDENLTKVSELILNKQKEANIALKDDVKAQLDKMQLSVDGVKTDMKKNTAQLVAPVTTQGMILNSMKEEGYRTMSTATNGKRNHTMNLNAVILQPTNFTDGTAPVVLPFRESGVDKLEYAPSLFSELIAWGTTSSNIVDWIERKVKVDNAAMRAEGAIMGEGDLEYEEKNTRVKIISEMMKATNESLKDVDFLAGEINTELLGDLKNLLDIQIATGDGTGQNLLGIIPQATASDMTAFTALVPFANNADVLRVALNQIYVAGNGSFMPNYITMHPTDVTTLDLLKDPTTGLYIDVPFYDANKMILARVRIVQSTRVAIGTYLVGDFNRAKGFIRDALSIRIWDQNGTDPEHNRSTVTGNMRLALRIKTYDKLAFVTGNFATDKAALLKP